MYQNTINIFTLVLGITGTVTGILGLVVSIYNSWEDRPRIRISFSTSMKVTSPAPGYKVNTEYFVIFVTNVGKRGTKITRVFLRLWNHKDRSNLLTSSFHNTDNILTDTHASTMYSVEKDSVVLNDIWYIGVNDDAGRQYRKYIKRFWRVRRPFMAFKLYLANRKKTKS